MLCGLIDSSGNTVKECVRHSVLKSQSSNNIMGHTVLKTDVQGCGRQLDHTESRPVVEVSFPVLVSPVKSKEMRPLLTGPKN